MKGKGKPKRRHEPRAERLQAILGGARAGRARGGRAEQLALALAPLALRLAQLRLADRLHVRGAVPAVDLREALLAARLAVALRLLRGQLRLDRRELRVQRGGLLPVLPPRREHAHLLQARVLCGERRARRLVLQVPREHRVDVAL